MWAGMWLWRGGGGGGDLRGEDWGEGVCETIHPSQQKIPEISTHCAFPLPIKWTVPQGFLEYPN